MENMCVVVRIHVGKFHGVFTSRERQRDSGYTFLLKYLSLLLMYCQLKIQRVAVGLFTALHGLRQDLHVATHLSVHVLPVMFPKDGFLSVRTEV